MEGVSRQWKESAASVRTSHLRGTASSGCPDYMVKTAQRSAAQSFSAAQRRVWRPTRGLLRCYRHPSNLPVAHSPFQGNHMENWKTAWYPKPPTDPQTHWWYQAKQACTVWREPRWITTTHPNREGAGLFRWSSQRNPSPARTVARSSNASATSRDIYEFTPVRSRTAVISAADASIRRAASRATWRRTETVWVWCHSQWDTDYGFNCWLFLSLIWTITTKSLFYTQAPLLHTRPRN